MPTRFYLCAFVIIATLLASSSALETEDEVPPLDDSIRWEARQGQEPWREGHDGGSLG